MIIIFLPSRRKFEQETWPTPTVRSQLKRFLGTINSSWLLDFKNGRFMHEWNFSALTHFLTAAFSWLSFSFPCVRLSELLSLRIETLLSQCNYICQTHLPVCPKNASMITSLVVEVVPRNMWHGSNRILCGRVDNYIAYIFSSLQLHINPRAVNICICLHLWQLSSEIHH